MIRRSLKLVLRHSMANGEVGKCYNVLTLVMQSLQRFDSCAQNDSMEQASRGLLQIQDMLEQKVTTKNIALAANIKPKAFNQKM